MAENACWLPYTSTFVENSKASVSTTLSCMAAFVEAAHV